MYIYMHVGSCHKTHTHTIISKFELFLKTTEQWCGRGRYIKRERKKERKKKERERGGGAQCTIAG
jgi:hypothetical protein